MINLEYIQKANLDQVVGILLKYKEEGKKNIPEYCSFWLIYISQTLRYNKINIIKVIKKE